MHDEIPFGAVAIFLAVITALLWIGTVASYALAGTLCVFLYFVLCEVRQTKRREAAEFINNLK